MSGWKIDPAQLSTALENTGTAYEALLGVVTEQGISDIFAGLTWGAQYTQDVPIALNEVLTEQQNGNLKNVANHIGAGITGVGNAAYELQVGNESQAATFQAEMLAAADDGDFSYFEQHGHQGGEA